MDESSTPVKGPQNANEENVRLEQNPENAKQQTNYMLNTNN